MRAAFAILTLALAILATAPSVEATDHVCVPPGTLNQACVGRLNGELCAWGNGASPISPICLSPATSVPGTVCVPPGTLNGMCIGPSGDGGVCAWIYGGPLYHYACVHPDGRIEACSNSLFSTIYGEGFHCLGDPIS